jgi:AcrR family transcriptional regulator
MTIPQCSVACLNGFVTRLPLDATAAPDGRRAGGERTRRLLIDAAQQLIAERGESAIRLRDLTELAGTNVAAVHYHFAGLGSLLSAAASEAVELIIDAQIRELDLLPADASLHQIAGAYFRPMVQALKGPSSKGRPYVRVLARVTSDPPDGLERWAETATGRAHKALVARLRVALPRVAEGELLFRVKCVGGILVLLSMTALEPELHGKSPEEVERILVPVIAGALLGG